MLSEQQIRLQLNDLHIGITDVLDCIDECAYTDAEVTLDHLQSDIICLRKEVTGLIETRELATAYKGRRWTSIFSNRAASL